jgi:hypothetical protein
MIKRLASVPSMWSHLRPNFSKSQHSQLN